MNEAKICNLGLSLLIRLNLSVEYLSFLGGGTQRPLLNNQSRAMPALDSNYPIHLDSKHDDTGKYRFHLRTDFDLQQRIYAMRNHDLSKLCFSQMSELTL